MLSSRFRNYIEYFIIPVAKLIAKSRVSPNSLTTIGFIVSIFVAVAFFYNNLTAAFLFLLLTSFFDLLDGAVARVTGGVTKFGGFLDSTLDRYSDSAILIGIAFFLKNFYFLIFIVLIGTFLVSYSRAKAEVFINKCDIGFAERAERLLLVTFVTFLSAYKIVEPKEAFFVVLIFLAVITHLTVFQRIHYTYKLLR